ncbi:dna repair protein-like protein rad18 [Westerdykella ornata]|uniref:Dna repair protein-like protein rad18 n=1 Tax=Westerdykella ornata TaxID=318751 RepID=A0A6A6JRR0_WESOR|nr:dna repair protein-like protein rad18 [Westerdykella ornata]KAF2278558.1 dna repair protein-like protein rad18 [Westerdykella ornata]
MCHEQLTVSLGPLINFIIGHNGSGKSAVLTALTLCLGGKAAATNRGQNLKAFIKEGTDHCTLRVKIKNEGAAAYKRDKYGKSIYVERHFNRAGTSGFRLRDENKRLVSTKKADLEDIIDAFALQIDNPMNVLTQDLARQFLNDSTPKDKYKFFLKGTQLQTLREDYNLIMNELQEMEGKAGTVKADVEVLEKQFRAALDKAKRVASLDAMKAREEELACQVAWATVEREERALANIDLEIARVSATIEQRRQKADEAAEQYEMANHAYSQANQALEDSRAQLVPKQQEVEELNGQWQETRKAMIGLNTQERDVHGKIQAKEKSIAKYRDQIQEQRRKQAEADGGQHAQKITELEEVKQEVERVRKELNTHDMETPRLREAYETLKREKIAAEGSLQDKRSELQRIQNHIRDLEQGGERDWTSAYPNAANLSKLLKAIENETGFKERPVGPMGRHVKLLRPEWSSILEKSFGGSLNAFVVTSKPDQNILSSLMRRMNCVYPIYIGKDAHIDTSAHEPDASLTTWLRVLRIDNNLVRNTLIVNHGIEQVALIPKRAEAEEFVHNGDPMRRNVKMCFAMSDRDPTKGHAINFNSNTGSINIGPILAYTFSPRMQADKEPQLRTARSHLERVKDEYNEALKEARAIQARLDECKARHDSHVRQRRNLVIQQQQAESSQERLEFEISAAAPDDGAIEQLQESLKEAEDELAFERGQLEDIQSQKQQYHETHHKQKANLEIAQEELATINTEIGKHEARAENLMSDRERALAAKNAALDAVRAAEVNKAEWDQARGAQLTQLEQVTSEAEQICDRVEVPPGEDPGSLERKMRRLAHDREAAEKELGGSKDELLHAANVAKKKYHEAREEFARTAEVMKTLKNALTSREQRWEKFRQDISIRARITFAYLLSERQFRGELKVDHKSQQLDIHVQPDITVTSGAGRQTKTLSGGEKSFSTICLLLSLWDAMGSPIRCLDEFDVFMDNVNRDISMRMMIGAARRAIGRQYILITPQAMNSIESVGDVKIIKMRDPERGQTSLNVSR